MRGKDLVMATLFGGGASGGGSSGGMWMQTGTVVFETDDRVATNGRGLPIDDSKGEPEMIFLFREANANVTEFSYGDFLNSIAAPNILPHAYCYGRLEYTGDMYIPNVVDNQYAIYKDATGLYHPIRPGFALSVKVRAGIVYRWIAIGGLSA